MKVSLRRGGFLAAAVAIAAGIATQQPARAAGTSSHVAYVTDFGTGSNDPCAPFSGGGCGLFPGSSIFVNALTGVAPGGTYTTADASLTVTVTDVSVAAIDGGGVAVLNAFDTIILYGVCDIGSHPATMTAINQYLTAGTGKVMIFDADRCSGATGVPPPADYSTFLFPFTASTPGPEGASGSYSNVEVSTLTTGLPPAPPPVVIDAGNDSVGDANTFVTFNPNWCGSITAENTLSNIGFVEAYARTPNGGLVIYEGEDFWFDFGAGTTGGHQRLVFDLMLKQQFNPDGLPCALPASGISLAPPTQTHLTGTNATVTATVVDANNVGQSGIVVTFTALSGPNAGLLGTATTDGSGNAHVSFTSAVGGTDVVQASFVDILSNTHLSNMVNAIFNTPPVAICQNVTIAANASCAGVSASIDNGSFDPDGDPITLVQSPAPPYALGSTLVTLTVSDNRGGVSSCTGTVTVVDITAPAVSCTPSVNPSGDNIPSASKTNEDGFYLITASDGCGAPTVTLGGIALASGETIKLTQSPGQSGAALVNTMGPLNIKHFNVGPNDAVITATDGSGNVSTVSCLVPPPPK
jgi:hypothetical protein